MQRLITICYYGNNKKYMRECIRFDMVFTPEALNNDPKCLHELLIATDSQWCGTPWILKMGDMIKFEDNKKVYLFIENPFEDKYYFKEVTNEI